MNTSPIPFGVPATGATRANNLNQGIPPGARHGVQPQDTLTQGYATPPVRYTPPAAETSAPRKGPSRLFLGLMGLTVALGVGVATLGPAVSGGTHTATQPSAAVTVQHDTGKADLKTELAKAHGVALQSSRIDTELSASGSFGPSREFAEVQPVQERTEANGYTFTVNGQRLIAKGGTEDVVVFDSREGQIPDYVASFQQEAEENWTYSTSVRPAGGAGTLASVAVTSDVYTGGSPNQTAELMTFDHVEGKRVYLEEILSPQQHSHVLNSVSSGLGKVPAGSLFQRDDLADVVNRSFSISDEGGKDLKLKVAVPGNSESNEGRVAEFTFSIPRDVLK